MAGAGKSTIAQTVAEREASAGRLGASFFFSRDTKDQSDPLLLIPTLAYQLAHFNAVYKAHVAKALQPNPDSASHGDIEHQLKVLLIDPISACKTLPSPIIVVIDALDECEPESVWKTIIWAFGANVPNVRQNIKILVTSRPEKDLRSQFHSSKVGALSKSWRLHEIGESIVSRDIELYLNHRLGEIAAKYGLQQSWPNARQRDILLRKAGTLFIVAATFIKFIDDDTLGPEAELDALTKDNVTDALGPKDALILLYTTVIDLALRSERSDKASRISDLIHTVVGTIILVKDPMTKDTLTAFLQGANVSGALSHLHSLIIVPATTYAPIRVLHQSFPEYLTNPKQSNSRFYIDPIEGHSRLAKLCIAHLVSWKGHLGTNNSDSSDGKAVESSDSPISAHLRYSCLHVVDHITASLDANAVRVFCEKGLVVWIEISSRLGQLKFAANSLRSLRNWYSVSSMTIFFPITDKLKYAHSPRKLPSPLSTSSRL